MQFSDTVSLTGSTLSNNVAEVAAVVQCLLAWRDAHIVIHTDSTFVLGLIKGGLMAMERDGWGDAPRHLSRGPPTPLLKYLLYLMRDRTGRLSFLKAKAHSNDNMNNIVDKLANEGQKSGRLFNISTIEIPEGWVDTAPVLCHQPLDYMTKLVVQQKVQAPARTIKFESFSDRWMVTIRNMFGVVLDPGNHISKVWNITVPEGLREVLWKEMNGAQVLGHRYYGTGHTKSDMGRFCRCGLEMSLGHILIGCSAYKLQPLVALLMDTLAVFSPASNYKTLTPDAWGTSPWYPLLALQEIEETALPNHKGKKKLLRELRKTRQKREWTVGVYYWTLWKWRMKEVHDDKFKFVPSLCVNGMRKALLTPVPSHLLRMVPDEESSRNTPGVTVRLTEGAFQ